MARSDNIQLRPNDHSKWDIDLHDSQKPDRFHLQQGKSTEHTLKFCMIELKNLTHFTCNSNFSCVPSGLCSPPPPAREERGIAGQDSWVFLPFGGMRPYVHCRLPPLAYLFGLFLLHAVTANGWHYPTSSRMQAGSFSVSCSCTWS